MTVDASQLRLGDPVTIHARITDFMAPHYPYPVVVRLGRADTRSRLVVVAYNDIAEHAPAPRPPRAFRSGELVHWDAAPAALFEFREAREGIAVLWNVETLNYRTAPLTDLRLLAPASPIRPHPEEPRSGVSKDEGAAAIQAAADAALRRAAEACRVRASYHGLAAFDLDDDASRAARMKKDEALRCAEAILVLARAADSEPCAESTP